MTTKTFGERAIEYAEQVISGDIDVCLYVKLASQRMLDDLKKSESDSYPYTFNPLMQDSEGVEYRPAERICYFLEQLPHVKGKWARTKEKLKLECWQVFIYANAYGWIHKETGLRRFNTIYTEIPRKNSKTTMASGTGLYGMARDDEPGAEVYSAATTADQARICWSIAKAMTDKSAGFKKRFGVRTYAHSIARANEGSFFQYLSSDSKGLDGLNTSTAIIDELHAHKTREVFDVMETSTGAREQPFMWIITTAGSDRSGICYEQRDYAIKILKGTVKDESYFGIIYTVDEADLADEKRSALFTDERLWAKANPNWGVSVNVEDIRRKALKALVTPSAQNNFLTKHLNVWVNADTAWLDINALDRCYDANMLEEDFKSDECIVALDLASKTDIAVRASMFRRLVEGKLHYFAFCQLYLPEAAVDDSNNSQYPGWVLDGSIKTTPGNIIDFDTIEDDLVEHCKTFDVREIPYDPFQATQLATHMMDKELPMVEVGATVKNFSEPMKELEAVIIDGRFHFNNKVLSWMFSNVVCHTDAKDNIFPRKERPANKIDGPVALIMSMNRWIAEEIEGESVYETRGVIAL